MAVSFIGGENRSIRRKPPTWWLSLGTPASSTTKTGCHDIAEILLKVALSTINEIKSNLLTERN
jgi:hypothetical protein